MTKKTLAILTLAILLCLPVFLFAQETDEVFFFSEKEVQVPIIMYHLITEKPKYIGKYGVTPSEVEKDLQYLKENDYTTVVMQDLIDFVERGKSLPKKPIVLTFDDGNASDFYHLYPLLQKYDMKAVLAIIGKAADRYTNEAADNPKGKYPNMTWQQVKEIHDSKVCEIQSHGYNVHGNGGSGNKKGESAEAYHSRLTADLTQLQEACELHLGYMPNTFVYPLGVIGKDSRKILEDMGFKASLGCEEGVNILRKGENDGLFKMRRYNRPNKETVEQILKRAFK